MRLETISEVDMSRRQFLKTMGKGAMAAVAPKTALKGLVGGAKTGMTTSYPKTPTEMKAWLLKLIKDRNLEQMWKKSAHAQTTKIIAGNHAVKLKRGIIRFSDATDADIKELEQKLVGLDRQDLMNFADPSYDEPQYFEDLEHVLSDYSNMSDDLAYFGGPMPYWITRYRVSQFMGRDVGMDHPFVKDRKKWYQHMGDTEYGIEDAIKENDFLKIIANSASPERIKEIFGPSGPKLWTQEELDKRKAGIQDKEDEPLKTKNDQQEVSSEPETPDSWRTQSVEFESKLVARLRHL
jgi:hypothetical protein